MTTTSTYSLLVCGNAIDGRTEVEIWVRTSTGEAVWSAVYETAEGWAHEIYDASAAPEASVAEEAVRAARKRLSGYVNRTGAGAPEGLTAPGLSLWLMSRSVTEEPN